jgi:hypothetical protein
LIHQMSLFQKLQQLPLWRSDRGLDAHEWQQLEQVATDLRATPDAEVVAALEQFLRWSAQQPRLVADQESGPFLLLRVLFDLPEQAPASERIIYKGWANWPPADPRGSVNLAWPLRWNSGSPSLIALYEGSDGRPYDCVAEFESFRARFPYRQPRVAAP